MFGLPLCMHVQSQWSIAVRWKLLVHAKALLSLRCALTAVQRMRHRHAAATAGLTGTSVLTLLGASSPRHCPPLLVSAVVPCHVGCRQAGVLRLVHSAWWLRPTSSAKGGTYRTTYRHW
jgi:hypothetical protein